MGEVIIVIVVYAAAAFFGWRILQNKIAPWLMSKKTLHKIGEFFVQRKPLNIVVSIAVSIVFGIPVVVLYILSAIFMFVFKVSRSG